MHAGCSHFQDHAKSDTATMRRQSIDVSSSSKPWHVGPVPACDDTTIDAAWQRYLDANDDEAAFDCFLTYSKKRSNQVDPEGMLKHKDLIFNFRRLNTNGRFKASALEASLCRILGATTPVLNKTRVENTPFAKVMCARLGAMLAHSRYLHMRCDSDLSQKSSSTHSFPCATSLQHSARRIVRQHQALHQLEPQHQARHPKHENLPPTHRANQSTRCWECLDHQFWSPLRMMSSQLTPMQQLKNHSTQRAAH